MTDPDHDDGAPRYGRFARWRDQEAPPDQAMASWALGLSLIGCLCGAPALVAIALAVVVLDRSIGGPDHGRVKAVAALVISVAQLAALAALVPRAVDWWQPEPGPPGQQAPSIGEFRAEDLHAGDCFDDVHLRSPAARPGAALPGRSIVTVIPCDDAHQGEVVDVARLGDAPSSADAVRAEAEERCRPALSAYVVHRAEIASVRLRWYAPGPGAWDAGDRTLLCIALDRDGGLRTDSLADPDPIF